MDKNLYDLPPEELADVPTVSASLREALNSLEADHDFLLKGDVFTKDMIEGYLELKWEEVYAFEHSPHPIEFGLYYSPDPAVPARRPAVPVPPDGSRPRGPDPPSFPPTRRSAPRGRTLPASADGPALERSRAGPLPFQARRTTGPDAGPETAPSLEAGGAKPGLPT